MLKAANILCSFLILIRLILILYYLYLPVDNISAIINNTN